MGFFIGKSNTALTEFDTVGQKPKFSSFKNVDRSVNKTIQSYMFKEKGEFSYDFNYLDEADYRSLLTILHNRNSLREGMFLLPIPYSHESTKAILPVTLANAHKAYWFRTTDDPADMTFGVADPPTFDAVASTEFNNNAPAVNYSEATYQAIDAYDTSAVRIAASSTEYSGLVFVFDLTDFIAEWSAAELRRLTFVMHGMESSPVRFFIYNHTQSAWYLIDERYYYKNTDFTESSFFLNKQLVAQFGLPWGDNSINADYLASSKAYIMAVPSAIDTSILVQYVRLFVNGYWVIAEDPEDIEDFAESFTGAGRSGGLTFLEV